MKSAKTRNKVFVVCVIVLLGILLALLLLGEKRRGGQPGVSPPVKQYRKDTLAVVSAHIRESAESTAVSAPATVPGKGASGAQAAPRHRPREATLRGQGASVGRADTAASADTSGIIDTSETGGGAADTANAGANSLAAARARSCAGDTEPPWVYPDPSGGLHRHAVSVVLVGTKPCFIEWKADSAGPFAPYNGDTIRVATTTTLYFKAHDSCNNVMDERQEYYEIAPEETAKYCPVDMEYVKAGQTRFCIDHYEWPNRLKALPLSFVSLYNAVDSCVSAGKRLCTSDEWTLACTGPYGWKYAYGNAYEPHACVSHDTTARPSGSKPECRGYFEVFDMAGNLAEWTNTRSDKNAQFYNVRGGFWESGPHTGCFDTKYSYYPQNRHNPVGFRCCKDAAQK
jgi:hypothetical protein